MAIRARELIAAAIIAFISWALITHWLPVIRLVPYAFITGISVTILGIVTIFASTTRTGHHVRPQAFPGSSSLSFTYPSAWPTEKHALEQRQRYEKPEITKFPEAVRNPFDELLDLVIRDFVRSWYTRISPGSSFPNQIDRLVRVALDGILEQWSRLDIVEVFVVSILPIFNEHMQIFADAERAVRGKDLSKDLLEHEEIAIAARYGEVKRIHPAAIAKSPEIQQKHLRKIVEAIIPRVLPDALIGSSAVRVLIREIASCAVLLPLMQMLSDPDFINQMIEAYGRSVLQERKTVQKLRAALDEHAAASPPRERRSKLPKLKPNDNERTFERFIFTIRHCDNLADAERFHDDLSNQVARSIEKHPQEATYLRRLEIGRKLLDQRINQLASQQRSGDTTDDEFQEPTLREVLYDATGLSYFMEYMDRHGLTKCVQFWIIVDGVRSSIDSRKQPPSDQASFTDNPEGKVIAQVCNAYLWRPELGVSSEIQKSVAPIVNSQSRISYVQYDQVRQAILEAQVRLFNEMNSQYFPDFKKSDLYQKWRSPRMATNGAGQAIITADTQVGSKPKPLAVRTGSDHSLPNRNAALKSPDLRRAIASSSDLFSEAKRHERDAEPRRSLDDNGISKTRRSLDDNGIRKPLFAEESDVDPLSRSMQSLDSDAESLFNEPPPARPAVDAVQERLDEIMDENESPETTSLFSDHDTFKLRGDADSERGSIDVPAREGSPMRGQRPSLASLGLLGTPSRRTVFTSDDLFGENEKMWEDESTTESNADDTITDLNQIKVEKPQKSNDMDDIHEAAPGDLGLAELVQSLTLSISKLEAQQSIVDSLAAKADLTGNAAELRILRKSKQSLEREIHRKELQRQQYIVQESDNTLYGKAQISIKNIMVGTEPDGHEFAIYVIEVSRRSGSVSHAPDGTSASPAAEASWAVARRYSEFHNLHRRLRMRFPFVASLEFPRRQALLTLQKDFLRKRRAALERYLRALLTQPNICRSIEFRAFLSQQAIHGLDADGLAQGDRVDRRDLVTRIYNSVTDGMEDLLGNVPARDQLALAGQSLISAAISSSTTSPITPNNPSASVTSPFASDFHHDPTFSEPLTTDPATAAEAQAEQRALEAHTSTTNTTSSLAPATQQTAAAAKSKNPLIPPLATFFTTSFQLNHTTSSSSFLRGRALILILQQLLGTTIERRIRSLYTSFTSPISLQLYLTLLRDTVWPDPTRPFAPKPERTSAQKATSKREAQRVLEALLIERLGAVVGKGVARDAAGRWSRLIGVRVLTRSVVWEVLGSLVEGIWGIDVDSGRIR